MLDRPAPPHGGAMLDRPAPPHGGAMLDRPAPPHGGAMLGGPAPPHGEFVLTLSCPDRPGIVHAVAACLYQSGCNILDSQQYADRIADRFFMRVHVEVLAAISGPALRAGFGSVASEFGMDWELHDLAIRPRVLIMVCREGHCLSDLLYRRGAESLGL